jgi:hypothetical protein
MTIEHTLQAAMSVTVWWACVGAVVFAIGVVVGATWRETR